MYTTGLLPVSSDESITIMTTVIWLNSTSAMMDLHDSYVINAGMYSPRFL